MAKNRSGNSPTWTTLLRSEEGTIHAMGYVVLVTIIGIGMITGAVTLRDGIVQEYGDLSLALEHLDQSYSVVFPCGLLEFDDETNLVPDDMAGDPPAGIDLSVAPTGPGEAETLPFTNGQPPGETAALPVFP